MVSSSLSQKIINTLRSKQIEREKAENFREGLLTCCCQVRQVSTIIKNLRNEKKMILISEPWF